MASENAVTLQDITFRYFEKGKRNILDHVDLTVQAGTITVLMGSSGCGKSTLAAVLAGLYPENGGFLLSGTITLFGRKLASLPVGERAMYLGFMFQNPDLQFCMNTLRSELIFCLENINTSPSAIDARIREAAEAVGAEELLNRPLSGLSGGEKQRAMLACIYALGSRLLILDEAFANIDRENALELMELLLRLRAEGRTILAIDHQIDFWKDAADEFIVLGSGARVLARGINRTNLDDFRDVFEQEGLFEIRARHRKNIHAPQGEDIHALREADMHAPQGEDMHAPRGEDRHAGSGEEALGAAEGLRGSAAVRLDHVTIPAAPGSSRLLLENASAEFERGTLNAIIGKSGSGKTTTFLSLLRQHPYSGRIFVDGCDISRLKKKELYKKISIVFQNPANQFITQNVLDEVTESLRIWHKSLAEDAVKKEAEDLLARYGLSERTRYSPYMLSQGQQRRLAVLASLTGGQQILLLDEPTYGQDYRSTAAIMDHLIGRVREEGLTVIFITHDRNLAGVYADRVYELRDSSLIETDPARLLAE